MDPLVAFMLMKGLLVAGALAFAVREIIVTGKGDRDPAFTRKLVEVFSAERRPRRVLQPRFAPRPVPPAAPVAEPEPLRRAA